MPETPRHKVFISYYHDDDQEYKNRFAQMMEHNIVDKSVGDGDIDDQQRPTDDILRTIREDYIADATVTVVLIGKRTWQRKYVDWEISGSLRDTRANPRCGLLGILLPSHPNFRQRTYNPHLIPPRLADNCGDNNPFAAIYHWPGKKTAAHASKNGYTKPIYGATKTHHQTTAGIGSLATEPATQPPAGKTEQDIDMVSHDPPSNDANLSPTERQQRALRRLDEGHAALLAALDGVGEAEAFLGSRWSVWEVMQHLLTENFVQALEEIASGEREMLPPFDAREDRIAADVARLEANYQTVP